VDTQVAVIRRAIQAQVDAERYRGPGRIILSAVKAYLQFTAPSVTATQRELKSGVLPCSPASSLTSRRSSGSGFWKPEQPYLQSFGKREEFGKSLK
jgi:hypothetical protein